MRRSQPRLFISLLCCVLALCPRVCAVQKMWSPTAFTWMEAWQRMAASPLMHPQLAGARMLLPLQVEDRPSSFLIDLVRGDEVIGLFFVRRDWQSIRTFELTDKPYREGAVAVPANRAEQVAREFVTTFYPDTPGTLRVFSDPHQYLDGRYAFEFQYRVQDVCIRSISIRVSHDGYIVAAGDYDLRTKQGVGDLLKVIPPSPGADAILTQTRQFLHNRGFPDASIAAIFRTIAFPPGSVTPVFSWQGSVARVVNGEKHTADITYAEATQQFTLSPWINHEDEDATRPFTSVGVGGPVWMPDGSGLWWESGVHWRGLPAWIPAPPSSLVTCKLTQPGSRPLLYRPVPDIDRLSLSYAYPSISPDQRWMTTMVFSRVHLVVDLLNNRLYAIPGDHLCSQRISWRSDSRQVVFVGARGHLHWLDVIGKAGTPFDVPERRVVLATPLSGAEFLPGSLNTVFAVICPPDAEGEAQDWHLATITLPELKDTPSVTPPKDGPTEPDADGNVPRRRVPVAPPADRDRIEVKGARVEILHTLRAPVSRMHVLPDGSGAIIALPDGLQTFSLNTRTLTPIPWLANGREVAPDTYFTNSEWDVSPDGRQIAFVAYTREKGPGGVICVANIDGTNIRRVSGGIEDRLERFRLQGHYYYVPKHQIAFGLMGRLSIPQFQDIEWPIITWGPWNRRPE